MLPIVKLGETEVWNTDFQNLAVGPSEEQVNAAWDMFESCFYLTL